MKTNYELAGQNRIELSFMDMTNCAAVVQRESDSAILQRHEGLIRHQAKAFVGKGIEMDDLMQEGRIAFLGSIKSWAGINGASLWSYARSSVFGALLRYSHYEKREPARRGCSEAAEERCTETTPESLLALAETLSVLSEAERDVIRMTFVGDLDCRAIAEELGIPKSTVHDTLKRAIGKLRAVVIGS
jgi:RNA polymerase sigma factor (sigma-70 family)